MEFLDFVAALFGIIVGILTVVILWISLYPTLRSLKDQERSLRFGVCYQVMEMVEHTRPMRHRIQNVKIKKDAKPEDVREEMRKFYDTLTKEDKEKFDEVARTFDKLGILVKQGVVPKDFVIDFYSRPIVVTWNRMQYYIKEERDDRPQKRHMKKFEELALFAKEHRDKEHEGEETFTSNEELPDWRKIWKK